MTKSTQTTNTQRVDYTKLRISKQLINYLKANNTKLYEKMEIVDGHWVNANSLHFSAKGQFSVALSKYNAQRNPVSAETVTETVSETPVIVATEIPVEVKPVVVTGANLRRNKYELENNLPAGADPNRKGKSKPSNKPAVKPVVASQPEIKPVAINNELSSLMELVRSLANEVAHLKAQPVSASTGKTININFSNL